MTEPHDSLRPSEPVPYEPPATGIYGPADSHQPAPMEPRPYAPMPVRPDADQPRSPLQTVGRVLALIGGIGFAGIVVFNLVTGFAGFGSNPMGSFERMSSSISAAAGFWVLALIGIILGAAGRRRR